MLYIMFIILIIWIACGIIVYGWTLAYFQREFPTLAVKDANDDKAFALLLSVFGPLGIIIVLTNKGYKHGLMFKTEEEND